MAIFWVVLVLQAFICGFLAMSLAEHKGHSAGAWFACGFFFGLFGLIAAAGLPRMQPEETTDKTFLKKCPDCAELIRKEAQVCKFCRYRFSKEQVISELISSLKDKSADNRLLALEYLETIRDSSVTPHILSAFYEADTVGLSMYNLPNRIRNKAAQLLLEIGDRSVIPQLIEMLKKDSKSSSKSNKIIKLLGEFRDPLAIPVLIDSLHKNELQFDAVKALQKIGQPALHPLEKLIKEGKRAERKLAEEIVSNIRNQK